MLLDELLEQYLYGDPNSLESLAQGASPLVRKGALKAAQRRLDSYGYKDQEERGALNAAVLTLTPGAQMNMAPMIFGTGKSGATKYVLVGGGLLAAWYLFIRKK